MKKSILLRKGGYPYGLCLVNSSRWEMAGGTKPPLEKGAREGVVVKRSKPAG